MARRIRAAILFVVPLIALGLLRAAAPVTPTDVQQPGTQPGEIAPYTRPDSGQGNCRSCHGNTTNPDFEPYFGWKGSMMANSARDPLFWAQLAVAEQDYLPNADPAQRGGVGDMCLRCHMPGGWLQGRSEPTNGSAMDPVLDASGVECEHCHLMVDPDPPTNVPGTVEQQVAPFVANDGSDGWHGTAMYVINSEGSRLGPYDDPVTPHTWKQSSFHRDAAMCGTCHDVSNPVVGDLAHNNGAQVPLATGYSGVPGAPVEQKAAFNHAPQSYGVIERTFSEWEASEFSRLEVDLWKFLPEDLRTPGGSIEVSRNRAHDGQTADYRDGTTRYFTCQTCHMSASTGVGCRLPGVPERTDLPRHDLTGSGYWVPELIKYQDDAGTLRFGGPVDAATRAALDAGMLRAEAMLRSAARLDAVRSRDALELRVTNLTGHKLITGYPEGRRMWLNVRWRDGQGQLVAEDGGYGQIRTVELDGTTYPVESILDPSSTIVFEAGPGIDRTWAQQMLDLGYAPSFPLEFDRMTDAVVWTLGDLAALGPGSSLKTFHFVLNNVLIKDNRIPPYGLGRADAEAKNMLPVPATQYGNPKPSEAYRHWYETNLTIPAGAVTAEVRLLYQQTSWEYIQFLWLDNDGLDPFLGDEGENLLDAWLNTGMSPPLEMASLSVPLAVQDAPGEASRPDGVDGQLHAALDPADGAIELSFEPACDATDHAVYWGPLDRVAQYAITGSSCGHGDTGQARIEPSAATGESLFFLVVGRDGQREGSYGRSSDGAERPEAVGSGVCDLPRSLDATCAQPVAQWDDRPARVELLAGKPQLRRRPAP